MFRTVEIPVWMLVALLALTAVTVGSHFLLPSVRWFLRRRAERLVARLNAQLVRPVRPFELARRTDTVARIVHDPKVALAIADHARENGQPEEVSFETARRYAREIVPSFSAILYFGVATRMARWLSRSLYRVRVSGRRRVFDGIDPDATIVFVMNHRSNVDYVLVTWLLAGRTSLSYAVGEWARRWPLRSLIRAMGGFFVRRRDLNPLYRRVLARYVQIATAAGVTQAVFPEGRLSRDGAIGPPKLGILSYILQGAPDGAGRDIVFVPVAIAYERVLEDRRLVAARDGPGRFRLDAGQVLRYVARHVQLRLRGRFDGFGRAAVAFGAPISLAAHRAEAHADPAAALGAALMARIAAVLPALPLPLVAAAIVDGARSRGAILARLAGSAVSRDPSRTTADDGRLVDEALAVLSLRGLVTETADYVAPAPDAGDLLAYYARSNPGPLR